MNCCHHCEDSKGVFGPDRAEADLRRYRRKGPDPSTRLILEELRRLPLEGTTVLDVGGGIGVLGLELMAAGAQRVVEVEASNASLMYPNSGSRHVAGGIAYRLCSATSPRSASEPKSLISSHWTAWSAAIPITRLC